MPSGPSIALPASARLGDTIEATDCNAGNKSGTPRRPPHGEGIDGGEPGIAGCADTRFSGPWKWRCGKSIWHPGAIDTGTALALGIDLSLGVDSKSQKDPGVNNLALLRGVLAAGGQKIPPVLAR